MISYLLVCILWSKPEIKVIKVPVNEYAMAFIEETFGEFKYEASVVEGRINSVKISHFKKDVSSHSYSASDLQLKSLVTRLQVVEDESSLDCDVRPSETTKGQK